MQNAVVQKGLKGTKLGALLDQGSQPVPQNTPGATLSGSKLWSSNFRCLSEKRHLGFGGKENAAVLFPPSLLKHRLRRGRVTAIGEETSNGYVRLETGHNVLKQSNGGAPQGGPGSSGGKQEGAPTAASSGAKGDLTAEQKAALQALDTQLNTLSDTDAKAGQRNARRKFAEDLARKSGRAIPSESPPSKRTLAGDYLDKAAWDQKVAIDQGFELDDTFLAYTGAALLVLTVVTNLFLNKFFPLPTREQVKEMRRKDEALVFPDRAYKQDTNLSSAPSLRGP